MSGSRTVRVAVAGCGVVGGELVNTIRASAARIERAHGVRMDIVRVLVRRPELPRPVELEPGVITADIDTFLSAEADVVAEAIGGIDPPLRIARAALERGIPFVTANKALIAASGVELARRAAARGPDCSSRPPWRAAFRSSGSCASTLVVGAVRAPAAAPLTMAAGRSAASVES